MANMKIENYTGTLDSFSLPYNPKVYDDSIESNHTTTQIDYQRHHIIVSGGGIKPKSIILTGHFSGASKRTNYRLLAKHFQQTTKLKKLFFESDKFNLGIGGVLKQTNTGGRTNFIDYVGTFQTVIGILFGSAEKTSGTNEGDVTTFVTEISGTVTSGASDITVTDGLGNSFKIPSSALTTGHSFTYKLVEMVDSGSGIYVSEYSYIELNGTQTRAVQTTGGNGLLQMATTSNVSTITTTNLTSAVVKFRDGWSG